MNSDIAELPIEEGLVFTRDELVDPSLFARFIDFFNIGLPTDIALIIIAAGCYFIGVLVASFLPKDMGFSPRKTIICAPISFLLTSPIWFNLMNGKLMSTNISAIDKFLIWSLGQGEAGGQMFVLGLVMLMGALSWPIFRLFTGIAHFVMSKFSKDSEVKPTPTPAPTD